MEKSRDTRYDTLKGFLILCVLFRHFLNHGQLSMSNEVVADFIHFFTMPLFVFISGFFTRHVTETKKYWLGILGIVETYAVFQIIKSIFYYHYSFIDILIRPTPMMWYLLALAVWRVLYYFISKIGLKIDVCFVVSTVIVALVAGFVPFIGRILAFSRILYFAPYFFGGILLQNVKIIDFIKTKVSSPTAWCILGVALVGSFFASYFNVNDYMEDIFRGHEPYLVGRKWLFCVFRLLSYVISGIVSLAIVRLFSFPNSILEKVGKDSLKFYMFQDFGLIAFSMLHFPWGFTLALVYATITSLAIWLFNKTRVSDIVLRPVNYFVKLINSNNSNKLNNG